MSRTSPPRPRRASADETRPPVMTDGGSRSAEPSLAAVSLTAEPH